MNPQPVQTDTLRVLLTCSRPLALDYLDLTVEFKPFSNEYLESLQNLLSGLNLLVIDEKRDEPQCRFFIARPYPQYDFLDKRIRDLEGVHDLYFRPGSEALDVHRPGEELTAIKKGMEGIAKSVEVTVIPHATRETLLRQLEPNPGFHMLFFTGHGLENGAIALEDETRPGWARLVGSNELVDIIQNRVSVFINGACHGEISSAGLLDAANRPPVLIHTQGEYVIPVRAIQLFSEDFFRYLVNGSSSTEAFNNGVEKIQKDDDMGEKRYPDGAFQDKGPSPFKRFQRNEVQPVSFPALETGRLTISELAPPEPPHRKIIRDNDLILGRETMAALLLGELQPPRSGTSEYKHALVNLNGEGGIGKTRLAQAVCDLACEYRLFPGGLFEVDCTDSRDTQQLALSILEALGIDQGQTLPDPVSALPLMLRNMSEEKGNTLLLLDNVDPLFGKQMDGPDPSPVALLTSIFTESDLVRVLSTCRSELNLGAYGTDYMVDPLENPIALELLLLFTPSEISKRLEKLPEDKKTLLKGIVNALDGHPLSIFLAAKSLSQGTDPLEKQLEKAGEKITTLLEAPDIKALSPKLKSLQVSLSLSFDQLSENGKDIFQKAGFFPGGLYQDVSRLDELLGANWREAMKEVNGLGLCRFDRDEQRFWMLNPIREYAEDLLLKVRKATFHHKAAEHWAEFTKWNDCLLNPAQDLETMKQLDLPEDPVELRKKMTELHSQAFQALKAEELNIIYAFEWAVENAFEQGEKIARCLIDYLELSGKRRSSAGIASAVLDKSDKSEDKAKWLTILASRLADLGDQKGARDRAEEALKIFRELAKEHPEAYLPDVAMSLNNLGNRMADLWDFEGAKEQQEQALKYYRKLAKKHPETYRPDLALSLNNLGTILAGLCDYEGARKRMEEALKIRIKLAEEHPEIFTSEVAGSLNNLGLRLSKLDEHDGARERLEEALKIYRELAREYPETYLPGVARSLNNLGDVLADLGDYEKAMEKMEEAINIHRELVQQIPEAYLSNFTRSVRNMSRILTESGQEDEVPEIFEDYIETVSRISENQKDPSILAQVYIGVSSWLKDMDKPEEALLHLDKAREILEPLAGEHRDALRDLITVNEKRLELIKTLDLPGAEELINEIEARKKLLQDQEDQPAETGRQP